MLAEIVERDNVAVTPHYRRITGAPAIVYLTRGERGTVMRRLYEGPK
jgi:hypothetical protein